MSGVSPNSSSYTIKYYDIMDQHRERERPQTHTVTNTSTHPHDIRRLTEKTAPKSRPLDMAQL
jgi:hypothetical protein